MKFNFHMQRILAFILTVLLTLPIAAEPADTFATAIQQRLDILMKDAMFRTSQVGLYVYDITANAPVYEHDKLQRLRPASNMKIMTAVTALSTLGADYQLRTHLYIDNLSFTPESAPEEFMPAIADPDEADSIMSQARHAAVITIKGSMDPLLGPDDLRAFAQALRDRGIVDIKDDIILDATFKDTIPAGWGWCWDDDNVPLTPFLYLGKAGLFETNLRRALKDAGITFSGGFRHGLVRPEAQVIATRSHTIDQVLHTMMKVSDNLFAECLFYHLASKIGKAGTSSKDAAAKVSEFIRKIGHNPADYTIGDGSGLSLYNYLSAELLVDVLRYAHAHQDIYNHLLPSLPIMGRDGTLRSRCIGTSAQDRVHAKTGTVRGVSSLSGYATAPNGHLLAFAIINQGISDSKTGRGFQDRVCQAITRPLDRTTASSSNTSPATTPSSIEPDRLPEASEDEANSPQEPEPEVQETF